MTMKNISIALNIILLGAVAYLYYLQFSGKTSAAPVSAHATDSVGMKEARPMVMDTTSLIPSVTKPSRIVYVNITVLDDKYEFITDKSRNYKARQAKLENDYQNMMGTFQAGYQELQQAAQAGIMPK